MTNEVVWLAEDTFNELANRKGHRKTFRSIEREAALNLELPTDRIQVFNTTDRELPRNSILAYKFIADEEIETAYMTNQVKGHVPKALDSARVCLLESSCVPNQPAWAKMSGIVLARVYIDRRRAILDYAFPESVRLSLNPEDDVTFAFNVENGPIVGKLCGFASEHVYQSEGRDYIYAKVRLPEFGFEMNDADNPVVLKITAATERAYGRYLYAVEPLDFRDQDQSEAAFNYPSGMMINGQETGTYPARPLAVGSSVIGVQSILDPELYCCSEFTESSQLRRSE